MKDKATIMSEALDTHIDETWARETLFLEVLTDIRDSLASVRDTLKENLDCITTTGLRVVKPK